MMPKYEVIREIFNTCANKWKFDASFPDAVETNDVVKTLNEWFKDSLPEYDVETKEEGAVVYTLKGPLPERYFFFEL